MDGEVLYVMSVELLTLIAESNPIAETNVVLPEEYATRPVTTDDGVILGMLHFKAYGPEIAPSLQGSITEMEDMYRDEFGKLWPEASSLVLTGKNLVASVLTVHMAPWEDTPTCPFIIDLMVLPDYRRQGLADHLAYSAACTATEAGKQHLALRVREDNKPALALYKKLGFVEWDGKLCGREDPTAMN